MAWQGDTALCGLVSDTSPQSKQRKSNEALPLLALRARLPLRCELVSDTSPQRKQGKSNQALPLLALRARL